MKQTQNSETKLKQGVRKGSLSPKQKIGLKENLSIDPVSIQPCIFLLFSKFAS